MSNGTAIVAGVGAGLGAALTRALLARGHAVAGIARRADSFAELTDAAAAAGQRFKGITADVSDPAAVERACAEARAIFGPVGVYVHNASAFLMRPFLETEIEHVERLWRVSCLGAAAGAHQVLPDMVAAGSGALLFTGATASLRGGANFAGFASAKFALRGLAQALAREFGPKGVHVAHVVIDGIIRGAMSERFGKDQATTLNPDDIAAAYMSILDQPPTAWTFELDLRPAGEPF